MSLNANAGGDDLPLSNYNLGDSMYAYDCLPPDVRAYLANMSIGWVATDVLHLCQKRGSAAALAGLRKVESDMQAAYRSRVGL